MKENKDIPEIRDDEIRVIGDSQSGENKNGRAWWWILAAVVLAAGIVSAVLLVREPGNAADRDEQEQEVVRGLYSLRRRMWRWRSRQYPECLCASLHR